MSAIARHWDVLRFALAEEKARAKGLVRAEEVSFLPAALEIVERPVSPTARATTWALLFFLAVTFAWITLGRVDVVASAQGRLIPADSVKLIQPATAGVVRAILVREGQQVSKGQPLVELDPTVSTAEAVQAERALETVELDAARARAILAALDGQGLSFKPPVGTTPAVANGQAALAQAQLDDIIATAAAHRAERQAAVSARGEATVQAAKLTETLPLLDEQIAANEHLLARGFVSKLKVIEMRRQRLAAMRDRDIALQTSNKAAAQMAGAGSSMAQSRAESRARILAELTKAEGDAKLRREELTKARQRSSLQQLLSPVDGTVAQLNVHTIGGVVEAAKPIMVVVPKHGRIIAEVKVLNKDIGFVKPGQRVAIKLEAFPFTRYGTIPGFIEGISSDSIEDEKLGLVFPARVHISVKAVNATTPEIRFSAGMNVVADIKTDQRSIISYLTEPMNEVRLSAARER